ncbi:EamA family transporter [Desulfoluna spongiiphila]|uniref:EamA-like transporter family protein n=1 Tax=Desulfoluna spongiiphila TaxID=419481 RepID=A0A1G5BSQ0_9BACT|nr:EamA family transporter [Desulfoluna spongiiphila]SCX93255.1 EamA-like transporter family protein [Desulfoluna spongiiphila]
MEFTAVALIIVSAFTHAGWNLLGKHEHPSTAFFLVATVIGTLVLSPVVLPVAPTMMLFPPSVWLPLALGGLFQCLYYTSLSAAYRCGELSVVYPIARAFPLVFVALGSFLLGRGDAISATCLAGGAFIMAGCFVLPQASFGDIRPGGYLNRTSATALVVALCTVGYSMADDHCIRLISPLTDQGISSFRLSLLYLLVQNLTSIGFMLLMVLFRTEGRQRLRHTVTRRLKNAAVTGIGVSGTYSLVLTAMNFASDVTYVVAFRQLSIPVGALMGMGILKESRTAPKFVGIGIMSVGLVLVAMG